jgi:hypothetical protein
VVIRKALFLRLQGFFEENMKVEIIPNDKANRII